MDDTDLRQLVDRTAVIDVVTALFTATDRKDWARVEACLTDPVTLDMTSLAGGEPAKLTPAQVAGGWREGLASIDHVHHQVGNFEVRVAGNQADVSCYGIAYHHRAISSPDNLRTFVGSYDVHLRRVGASWRIELFKFNAKFVTGNLELEKAT